MKKTSIIKNQSLASGAWLLLGLLLLTPTVQAAPLIWDITPGDGAAIANGSGNWGNGAGNWNSGAGDVTWNNATPDSAIFGKGTNSSAPWILASVVTLTNAITVGNMTFTNWNGTTNINYQITGNTLTLSNTPTIMTRSDGQISSTIAGTGFVKDGAGILRIDGTSGAYVGNVTVNAGILQIGNNGSGGQLGTGNFTNNATVTFRRSTTFTITNGISGSGNVAFQMKSGNVATVKPVNGWTYAGTTSLSPTTTSETGGVKLGGNDRLPVGTALTLGVSSSSVMTFDLNGFNQTLGSLATAGTVAQAIVTSSAGPSTLTISGTNSTTFAGLLSGNLALVKNNTNTFTLTGVSTYTGNTTINGGTLKLGVGGSIDSTPQISITAGGTLDVSSNATYVLSASTTLKASGTNTAATINGNAAGTVSLGSQAISLNYDGTNAALTIAQGQLLLNGNSFTVNRATPLAAGDYTLITNLSSTISSNGTFTVSGTAISGTVPTLLVGGSSVVLHLVPAPINPTNSTVVASPDTLPADNSTTSTVTVTIRDNSSNAISGIGVSWTVSGLGNTMTPASSGITDGSGQTSFTVKSVKAETKTVIVSVGANTFTNLLTFTNPAVANVFTWDPAHNTTGSDGLGTWDTSTANWANNSADVPWPNNGNDAAVIGTGATLGASTVITLGVPISAGNLTFNTGGNGNSPSYQVTGQSITLSNTPIINVPASALISSILTGPGFVKDGAGVLRIDGNATNLTGSITVSNGWLQIGNNGGGGNLGTATINLVDPSTFSVRKGLGGSMILSNLIAGATSQTVGFQLNNNSVVTLARANTYTATNGTYLQPTGSGTVGTLKLGINNALPTATAFSINLNGASLQTFDLAGFNQTLGSLGGTGTAATVIITNSVSATASTLTVSGAATTTFNGKIVGNLNVDVDGSGSLTLSANNYSGNTTVKGATLVLQQPTLSTNSTVTVTNGVLNLAFALNETNQVAALVLNGTNMAPGLYSAATESPYLAGTGSLLVVPLVTINPNPPVLQVSYGSGTLSLAWPTNAGWILQSNSVSLTTPGAWFNYPADGSVTVTNVTITVDPAKTNVFYRMLKP